MSSQNTCGTGRTIVIVTAGSRGDVQPYCLLGRALVRRGERVIFATEKRLEAFVATHFDELPLRFLESDLAGCFYDAALQPRLFAPSLFDFAGAVAEWNSRFDRQKILNSVETALADGFPLFLGTVFPPTTAFPHAMLRTGPLTDERALNHWTHTQIYLMTWRMHGPSVNAWRRESLGLPPMTDPHGLMGPILTNDAITLYHASSLLVGPRGHYPSDWTVGKVVFAGAVFPDREKLSGPVAIEVGNKYLSTGWWTNPWLVVLKASRTRGCARDLRWVWQHPMLDPLQLVQLMVQVCHTAKCRCCPLINDHADILCVESSVEHAWLFPRVNCIVHHAGAGTTAAALRSGVPQVPCPAFADQYNNANELVALGVAISAVPKADLTAETVADGVRRVLANENYVRGKAKALAEYVETESQDAVERLCDAFLATPPTFKKEFDNQ
ncbi:Aste57867_1210 [Aphanomyces stellatus]|uniref:Aste57867_1210 protein n=1 Tax=Aphanomyces stellatus TaxID=120398 RepID=A0A485K4T1_9STRA|nr:hypothetical protein As57867_001209 [Aphanomyces stellatus]VFT78430.1 Aste57867_1210 [Aphanomyces stellatus]